MGAGVGGASLRSGMTSVFLNGELLDRDDARVSAFDAGLQHGVGLFETMDATGPGDPGCDPGMVRVRRLDEHLERLCSSAAELGLSDDLRSGPLGEAVRLVVARPGLARARVRLTLTGGDLNLLQTTGRSGHTPTVLIQVQPATAYPDEMFERGVGVTIADARANPLDPTAGHKTLNYWQRLRELQRAAGKGAGEALMFQVTNHVCGGCVSNLFAVKDGTLVTPIARGEEASEDGKVAMPSPVLPGITRAEVIEIASGQGVGCARRMLTIDDVLDADEVFLTNSSWGVLPAVRVEAEAIGDGAVGELTRSLREAWVGVGGEGEGEGD